jgi:hypothetical protein
MSGTLLLGRLILLTILVHSIVAAQPRAEVLQAESREILNLNALPFVLDLERRRHPVTSNRDQTELAHVVEMGEAQRRLQRAQEAFSTLDALPADASVGRRIACVNLAFETLQAVFERQEIGEEEYKEYLEDLQEVAQGALGDVRRTNVASFELRRLYLRTAFAVMSARVAIGALERREYEEYVGRMTRLLLRNSRRNRRRTGSRPRRRT